MTRTFNHKFSGQLLAKYQPKTITTEQENEQAMSQTSRSASTLSLNI
ncbi:hypothetical protein [Tolypothrix sp. VBCCA 56010]